MLLKKHDVVSIQERPRNFGKCEHHKDVDIKFFCEKCRMLICIDCKISGNHSVGEQGSHTLKKIEDAYNEAVTQANIADPQMDKYKASLKSSLKQVDIKIDEISQNAKEKENELYKLLEAALETLHAHAQTKLNVLLADQLELKRRYEEVQWSESFLKYQLEVLEPHQYLKSWFR